MARGRLAPNTPRISVNLQLSRCCKNFPQNRLKAKNIVKEALVFHSGEIRQATYQIHKTLLIFCFTEIKNYCV